MTAWENPGSYKFNCKKCLSLRVELAFKLKTKQAKQDIFRHLGNAVTGKVYQPAYKYV